MASRLGWSRHAGRLALEHVPAVLVLPAELGDPCRGHAVAMRDLRRAFAGNEGVDDPPVTPTHRAPPLAEIDAEGSGIGH